MPNIVHISAGSLGNNSGIGYGIDSMGAAWSWQIRRVDSQPTQISSLNTKAIAAQWNYNAPTLYIATVTLPSPTVTPSPTPPSTGNILNVPLFKQGIAPYNNGDPDWEMDEFDHANTGQFLCGTTMAQCGCSTTSVAMVFKALGIERMPSGQLLTPGTLNTWLKENNGYNRDKGVDWTVAATLSKKAKNQNPNFKYDALEYVRGGNDKNILRDDINKGIPNILEVPGHFIVATGIQNQTFTINDPFYNRTNLLSYNDTFYSTRRYIPSNTNLSYITLVVDKEIDISLIDSSGNSVGESYIEYDINDATAEIESTENISTLRILTFAKPPTDSYQINARATLMQNFQLDIKLIDQEGNNSVQTYKGIATPDTSNKFTLSYDNQSVDNSVAEPDITFDKLKSDLKSLYSQGKIKSKLIYTTLKLQAELAERAKLLNRQPLGTKLAILALKTFQFELNKVRGKSITEEAYQILYNDAKFLIEDLQRDSGGSGPTPTPEPGGS